MSNASQVYLSQRQGRSRKLDPAELAKGRLKDGVIDDPVLELVRQADAIGAEKLKLERTRHALTAAVLAAVCKRIGWHVGVVVERNELWIELPGGGDCCWRFTDGAMPLLQNAPEWRSDGCPPSEPQDDRLVRLVRQVLSWK